MADVTGTITDSNGTKDVQLNNAATEATLRLLLQSSLATNKQSIASIQQLAQQSGLNPATVAAANQGLEKVKSTGSKLGTGFEALGFAAGFASKAFNEATELTKKIASGSGEASDVFAAFKGMPLGIGLVFSGMQKLAAIQESYLKTYQVLSNSGVNFSGSLTQMRMAAASTYMTLDQFSGLMKTNGEAFSRMGGTVDDGARAFVNVSKQLQKSEMGDQLRALGFTSEQANQGLASYIAMTGGRNKQEMQDTKALSTAAGEYMMQLDALTQISGKSREAQEQALKEQAANAAYQSYLLTLDEEGKKKANAALANAMATGGKGAADALQSSLMGLPPMTKAAQEYTAMFSKSAAATQESANAVKDSNKTLADVNKIGAKQRIAATQDVENLGNTANALVMTGNTSIAQMMSVRNQNIQQGVKTEADALKQREEITAKQQAQLKSEADAAADANAAIKALGQQIIDKLMPVFGFLLEYVNKAVIAFTEFVSYLIKSPKALGALMAAVVGVTAVFVAFKVAAAAATAIENTKKIAAGLRSGGVTGALGALGPLGTRANPMYVIALNTLGGGGRTTAGGGSGTLKTMAKFAKLGGVAGSVMGAASLYGSMGDIAEQEKSGELTAEEAKKAKGGAIGEAGGGIAGAAAGAAMGAALGSVVPVLGTAIGGIIGGAIGGFGGGELGKMAGEWIGSSPAESAKTPPVKSEPTVPPITKEALDSLASGGPTPATRFMSTMQSDIRELNGTMREVLKYMKETAEFTKRNVDATKALSGNLFPAP